MQVYRSRGSQVWGWIMVGIGAAILIAQLVRGNLSSLPVSLGVAAAVAAIGAATFLRPSVVLRDSGVEVRNVTHIATMSFDRLDKVGTRWSLELRGDDSRVIRTVAVPTDRGGHVPAEMAEEMVRRRDAWKRTHPRGIEEAGPSCTRTPDWVGIGLVAVAVVGVGIAAFA